MGSAISVGFAGGRGTTKTVAPHPNGIVKKVASGRSSSRANIIIVSAQTIELVGNVSHGVIIVILDSLDANGGRAHEEKKPNGKAGDIKKHENSWKRFGSMIEKIIRKYDRENYSHSVGRESFLFQVAK